MFHAVIPPWSRAYAEFLRRETQYGILLQIGKPDVAKLSDRIPHDQATLIITDAE